jgi:hypothetical protein
MLSRASISRLDGFGVRPPAVGLELRLGKRF